MKKNYANSPIVEAICEFEFEKSSSWDLTIPGIIYGKIKDDFPEREEGSINTIRISSESKEPEYVKVPMVRFFAEDKNSLIQVGPDILTINHLSPYTNWEDYLPIIENGLQVYYEEIKPKTIRHISLKYLNRIDIPEKNIDIVDYFKFRPITDLGTSDTIMSCIVGVEFRCNDGKDLIKIQLNSLPARNDNETSFLLELNYHSAHYIEFDNEEITNWLATANKIITKYFEASITDKLRILFEEVE